MRSTVVTVVPYDSSWEFQFEKIKLEIEDAIGDIIVSVEHIGSTSVVGLSAKPCIDIDIVIKDYTVFREVADRLKAIGYLHEGDLGIKDREAFKYSDKSHLAKHHLYVCPENSGELKRHIAFRNYLMEDPEAVRKYSALKEEGARLFPCDIDKYIEYKSKR